MIYKENEEIFQNILKYRETLSNWLKTYKFEWFVTMNLPNSNVEDTEKYLKLWRQKLCTLNHIRICYMGIVVKSQYVGNHAHILLFGRNKHNQTLFDMNKVDWQNEWSRLTKRKCYIENVNDNGVTEYVCSSKNTPYNCFELLQPYNKIFLNEYNKQNE